MGFKSLERRKEYHREWYLKNHSRRLQQIKDFRNKKRKLYCQRIVNYLKSHPCVDCGNSDIRVLEFDHMGNKTENVMTMVKKIFPWKLIVKEIKKCKIRCSNCHKIKTYQGSFRDVVQ